MRKFPYCTVVIALAALACSYTWADATVPLQRNLLPGYGTIIKNAGYQCNSVQNGYLFHKDVYALPDYSGPIEFCVVCDTDAS